MAGSLVDWFGGFSRSLVYLAGGWLVLWLISFLVDGLIGWLLVVRFRISSLSLGSWLVGRLVLWLVSSWLIPWVNLAGSFVDLFGGSLHSLLSLFVGWCFGRPVGWLD